MLLQLFWQETEIFIFAILYNDFSFHFSGQKSACDVLIRRGGQISSTNLKENPPLHLANRHGHWSVADSLLKEGADPEQPDGSGIQNHI